MSGFFGGGGTAYSNFTGSSSTVTGSSGLVPAPAAGEQNALLTGDATFTNISSMQRGFINTTQEALPLIPYRLGTGGVGPSDGTIYFNHVYCPASTYTKIGVQFGFGGTSGAGTTYRIGLYDCNQSTLAPVNRVYQSAQTNFFSLATAIQITGLSIVVSKSAWYAVAFIMASRGSWTAQGSTTNANLFLTSRTTNTNTDINGLTYSHTGTTDSLPDPLTASSLAFTNAGVMGYLLKS